MSRQFQGTINIDIKDSMPDWEPYRPADRRRRTRRTCSTSSSTTSGFSAMESFGGLIETPNIKRIADRGLMYTNFHTTALCSPDALVPADGPQPHDELHGLHHRGRVGVPERERPHPGRVRDDPGRSWASSAGTPTSSASGISAPKTR